MITIIHFSDLHFGSGERYGSINPESGLNKRFEDFISALDTAVNFAVENNADLVIFTGDTYKHATPEPVYQREFAKRIKKLSLSSIPTLLVVGNHDILYKAHSSDALDIYSTLEIEHVTVFNKIDLKNIQTKNGIVQVIGLPHITKGRLLTKEENRSLSPKEQDELMINKIKEAIKGFVEKLNPDFPSIIIGHGTIETAKFGSEQELSIGKVLSYPLSFFQFDSIDYVGFGHIHRHQVLQKEKPLILYAGSLERVDFGEENEDKGFVYLKLQKGKVSYEFKSINPRPFITISCDLTESIDPQTEFLTQIKKEKKLCICNGKDAIIRVRYKIQEENLSRINPDEIRSLLSDSFTCLIQADLVRKERTARFEGNETALLTNPALALDKYLFDYNEKEKSELINLAKGLIENVINESR